MIVKLLIEHHLEFLSLKEGCRGSSESTLVHIVKMSNYISSWIGLFSDISQVQPCSCWYKMVQGVINLRISLILDSIDAV